jgi:hypothetical protein
VEVFGRMRVADLITRIRLRAGDMQRTRFSGYEMLRAVNDAFKMLWIALAENFSSIPRVKAEIPLVGGTAPLPENYYTLVSISDNARIDGYAIRGEGESVTLVYNAIPSELGEESEINDVFPEFELDLTEIASAIAQGNIGGAVSAAAGTARRISQKREYSKIPNWRHFS